MRGETRSRSRAHSIMAGSVASELCVLAATTCTGATAVGERANAHPTPQRDDDVDEQRRNRDHGGDRRCVLHQQACGAETCLAADAERQREDADGGDQQHPVHHDDHRFRHGAEEARQALRCGAGSSVAAKPNRIANTTSARIALSAAAATMFGGSSCCSQSDQLMLVTPLRDPGSRQR